ncbi:Nitrate reductase cytochrome c-type subunit (NapB) [Pseudovibrio sp. FO-BEG1]|uniref:Periplasmic nitrate reductase, electron transfer subunit n=2 Tax=Pseudovibrio TaxID=258255 RepID=A0A1I7DDI9_9HYPH|nr:MULTISPECIES: nitrate reductase cytochrome c-type subunit [Pseudovibrio]AEV36611.1 Nitrate reductase cytochrome c-type subunit (NapB) [Pseudovibrio sp. FO-BEG1]EEA94641.1 periplasmic nitrate reductase, diheme cytochrome c subunit [Pseudovibrio sp. JE062]QUS58465.1 nitrate reductase cytochrome c-type subunit [Pseudovibrio brasiliensis]SFU09675.1 periplasmic nitrate reductase subunit NapB [Pseudovibrio denitrificans]
MKLLKLVVASLFALSVLGGASSFAADSINELRNADILTQDAAPRIPKVVNSDERQVRNYPEQPPLIPHKIDGYQIDKRLNKCMTCHSRKAIEQSQAPMISITHFMNRDNQFLASVSPRRFFCTQCHVPQTESKPLVENTFVDVDEVLKGEAKK